MNAVKYWAWQVLNKIVRSKLFYSILFVELILCFSLIIIGLDEQSAWNARRRDVAVEDEKGIITISEISGFNTSFAPIKEQFFHSAVKAGVHCLYAEIHQWNFLNNHSKVDSFPVIVGNYDFFQTYLGINAPDGSAYYCSKAVKNRLDFQVQSSLDTKINFSASIFHIENNTKTFRELDNRRVNIPVTLAQNTDIVMGGSIFVFAESVNDYPKGSVQQVLKLLLPPEKSESISVFFSEMNNRMPNLKIYSMSPLAEFMKGSLQLNAFIRVFSWVSYIALTIVCLGAVGILLIFLDHRKKEYTINYLCGLSTDGLRKQLLVEMLVIFVLAFAMGVFMAYIAEPSLSSIYYLIRIKAVSILVGFGLSIGLPLLITWIGTYWIKEKSLLQWMKR